MKIGLCAGLAQAAKLNPAAVDYIEGMVFDALAPESPDSEFGAKRAAIEKLPLPLCAANCFIPGTIKTTGPDVDRERVDRYVRTVFERAKQVGITTIVFGSGGSRMVPQGFPHDQALRQLADHLKRWGDWAGACGVTIVIEPLFKAECNIILSVPEGQRLAEAVDHEAVRLLADFFHMGRGDEPPEHLTRAGTLLRHLHIAEKATRKYPGFGKQDFRPYLRALKQIGYGGAISLECAFDDLRKDLPVSVAYVRGQLAEAGF